MKTCSKKRNRAQRSGFSLLEVMIALLLLSVMTIGGAAMMMHSGETLAYQENKRAAIEAANRRMELIRSTASTYFNGLNVGQKYWLEYNGTVLVTSGSNPNENILINGSSMPITTEVMKIERTKSSGQSYAAVEVYLLTVTVDYRPGSSDTIVLESFYY